MSRRRWALGYRRLASLGAIAAWGLAVAMGLAVVWQHAATPGALASPPIHWPDRTQLRFHPGLWHVVVVCHPYCPCTRATLAELARVVARVPPATQVQVVITRPGAMTVDWSELPLYAQASRIPNAVVVIDEERREPSLWGVQTSGHVLVFAPNGQLSYSGGITAMRGHEGDNAGADAVRRLLRGEEFDSISAPVFGCPLVASTDAS